MTRGSPDRDPPEGTAAPCRERPRLARGGSQAVRGHRTTKRTRCRARTLGPQIPAPRLRLVESAHGARTGPSIASPTLPLLRSEDDLDVRASIELAATFGSVRRNRIRRAMSLCLEARALNTGVIVDDVLHDRLRTSFGERQVGHRTSRRVRIPLDSQIGVAEGS